jgi:aminoglycoside phosphotransferase (APT) family kinase protein
MRDTIPRLEAFLAVLPKHSNELNNVKLPLAHKDLHFANMLYNVTSHKITAILDWEFSGVVLFTKRNPTETLLMEWA